MSQQFRLFFSFVFISLTFDFLSEREFDVCDDGQVSGSASRSESERGFGWRFCHDDHEG
jgi:hypothetical protein